MIEEWDFSGVDFDGLHPAECLLLEAKHGYDGFLETDDWSAGGRPSLQDWVKNLPSNPFDRMVTQAAQQHRTVKPLHPDVRLKWVFSSQETKVFVYEIFLGRGWWEIEPEHRPFSTER